LIEPQRVDFEVACAREHAFATWGERFAQWWPTGHTSTGATDSEIVFEPPSAGAPSSERPRATKSISAKSRSGSRPGGSGTSGTSADRMRAL
jgi:hypothetical protein